MTLISDLAADNRRQWETKTLDLDYWIYFVMPKRQILLEVTSEKALVKQIILCVELLLSYVFIMIATCQVSAIPLPLREWVRWGSNLCLCFRHFCPLHFFVSRLIWLYAPCMCWSSCLGDYQLFYFIKVDCLPRLPKIIIILHYQPTFGRTSQCLWKTQCHFRTDVALSFN